MLANHRLTTCILGLVVLAWATWAQERPQALENLQKARDRFETATVDYFYRRAGVGPPAGVYRTARVAGPDLIDIVRGTPPAGSAGPTDEAAPSTTAVPTLKRDREIWTLLPDSATVLFSDNERAIGNATDIRTLGINCYLSYADVHSTLWQDQGNQPGAREYSERLENGLYVVTARTDHGDLTWWIDPERDWNAVRVTAAREGRITRETRISLRKFDDVWFPDTVLNFNGAYDKAAEPAEVIRVVSAVFNDPKQPRRFKPADIGVEPGMTVQRPREPAGTPLLFFDGKTAIGDMEYREKERKGEVEPGPAILRTQAKAQAKAIERLLNDASLEKQHTSAWAEYVREFILKYQLDAEQTDKAIIILHACEDRAGQYVQKKRSEFQELERSFNSATAHPTPDASKLTQLARWRAELIAPIDDIFEKQLKPRLEMLPTRAQRRAADPDARVPARP